MGMAAILVMWPDNLNKLSFSHPKEAPHEFGFNRPSGYLGKEV